MGRAKIIMEFIVKEKSRNATFAKRKKGLKKKLHEFTTLCAVDAFMIIYYGNSSNPEIWPENQDEFDRILNRYLNLSIQERSKRSENLYDQNERRIKKMKEDLAKRRRKNNSDLLRWWDPRIDHFTVDQCREAIRSLDSQIEIVSAKISLMKGQDCILEGGSGMIEYSHGAPDQGFFVSSDPVHPLPITYTKPDIDHHFPSVNYPSDLDSNMLFDMGPMAHPLMFPRDAFDGGLSWNFSTWPFVDRPIFCDSELKAFDEIDLASASSSALFASSSSDVQPIQQWSYLSYTAPRTTQQMSLPSNTYDYYQDQIQDVNYLSKKIEDVNF